MIGTTLTAVLAVSSEDGEAGVFSGLAATAHLADPASIGADVETALFAIGGAAGVDRRTVTIQTAGARPGRHGSFIVSWRQGDRKVSSEGSTLRTALTRAMRASGAVSANTGGGRSAR